jgi:hypothetical protein
MADGFSPELPGRARAAVREGAVGQSCRAPDRLAQQGDTYIEPRAFEPVSGCEIVIKGVVDA